MTPPFTILTLLLTIAPPTVPLRSNSNNTPNTVAVPGIAKLKPVALR
jgi:hypothetical protein